MAQMPAESVHEISAADFRALRDNISLAADLGAETVWLKSVDVVKVLLDFAHEHKITPIIVGRTHPTLINRLLRRSMVGRIIAAAGDFAVEPIGQQNTRQRR